MGTVVEETWSDGPALCRKGLGEFWSTGTETALNVCLFGVPGSWFSPPEAGKVHGPRFAAVKNWFD